MIKCASLALYNSRNRKYNTRVDTFDEKHHRLTRDGVNNDYNKYNPDHGQIYKFIRTI